MKLSIICFSLTGLETAIRLKTEFEKQGHRVLLASKSKYLKDSIQESVLKWTESRFSADDGILFVGACGIAVRSIAPYVASKKSDPAVLVIDECGKFVISLLSGHLGGANELALTASEILNAQAVVTTATDLHERFAVDIFAKKNGCDIMNMTAAKEVSAAVLAGEKVGFYSEFPWTGTLPQGLILCDRKGVPVSPDEKNRTGKSPGAVTEKQETGKPSGEVMKKQYQIPLEEYPMEWIAAFCGSQDKNLSMICEAFSCEIVVRNNVCKVLCEQETDFIHVQHVVQAIFEML